MKTARALMLASFCLSLFCSTHAQTKASGSVKSATITYQTIVNGTVVNRGGGTQLQVAGSQAKISATTRGARNSRLDVPNESTYVDYQQQKTYQVAEFKSGLRMSVESTFSSLPQLEILQETAVIAGFECKKAQATIRSNKLEIWYTEKAGLVGTPMINLVIPNALIVKVVRNGNNETVINNVEYPKTKEAASLFPANWGEMVDAATYRARIIENYVTTIPVFDREQLSFGNEITNPEGEQSNVTYKFSKGTVLLKKVTLPAPGMDYSIFAELVQYSNGDAYDRTGSVFVVPTDRPVNFLKALQKGLNELPIYKDKQGKAFQGEVATEEFSPLVELVRFFTPFGIRKFNDQKVQGQKWEDSTFYKQDITPILSRYTGEVWIGVFIGNYDRGGHIASLKLKYYPEDQMERATPAPKKWILPLFNTVNVMEMSGQEYGTMFDQDSLHVKFTLPKGIKNLQLQYITTGHGGWGGGDEFNQKTNQIIVDGQVLYSITPWRSDCATFRKFNPASGNFWNGTSSSDLSRSGWCPGTATNPQYLPLGMLTSGEHTLKVAIPLGKREGGSFSAWCVSGVLIGEME